MGRRPSRHEQQAAQLAELAAQLAAQLATGLAPQGSEYAHASQLARLYDEAPACIARGESRGPPMGPAQLPARLACFMDSYGIRRPARKKFAPVAASTAAFKSNIRENDCE